jgi:H-type small acid-soluble spore protein
VDAKRAEQIIDATDEIMVSYRGASVWIDTVNSAENTATVHRISAPKDEIEVQLEDLSER